ncbi:Uu.00g013950.m01.CDS01 [Anthostomella pinea]|uniref:Uu.00g013950.m01.CDS01 n=1 Tax=Anthostomella pinea TaxID=933095 RepID=A0AAI8VY88_9PEZI|nr:Uu.00g013950.m01.CDS01 [Anthostomella pinea]
MRFWRALELSGLFMATGTAAAPQEQKPMSLPLSDHSHVGHFSEWSRQTKKEFLIDWQRGRASEWILVQGNEAGDLDSMVAALAWAYHLDHATANTSSPLKAIALLQTDADALDLRPENSLVLKHARMQGGHSDILTIDELPEDPETLSRTIRGVVLVDHPEPLRRWDDAAVLSIFDHHKDRGAAPDAKPRVFENVASCTTLVARQMLDELEALPREYHMPHELLQMILSAVALDSSGLRKKDSFAADVQTAERVLGRSRWAHRDLDDVMDDLDGQLSKAKKDIDGMGLRDLLRRDWKGDLVDTPSARTPTVSLGFASVPFSMDEQIEKTEFRELFDWFAIEAAWTAESGVDISVTLSKRKVRDAKGKKKKIREITLVVRSDVRIDEAQADDLFRTVVRAIEGDDSLTNLRPWHGKGVEELGARRAIWTHERSDAGRKVIRPLVEAAVRGWD